MPRPLVSASLTRLLPALVALGLGLGLAGCGGPVPTSTSAPDTDAPTVALRGGTLVRYDEAGRPLWALEAQRLERFPDARQTRAQGVRLTLYDAEGREALTLTARELWWDHDTGTLELRGEVRGERAGENQNQAEELRFAAERVRWDEAARALLSDRPVTVEGRGFRLTGAGFELRPEDGTLSVQSARLKLFAEPER